MNADAQLHEAREAWAQLRHARIELSRLRRYARMTDGMKLDRDKWASRASDAEATLQRILGGLDHERTE